MNLYINDKPYDISKVTYRQLGFGEKIVDRNIYLFKLTIEFIRFKDFIQNIFDSFVKETREDDDITDSSDAIEELVQYDYPSFEKLERIDRNMLCRIVKKYLFFELLEACFDRNDPDNCLIAINSINSIENSNNKIILIGEAYPITET